MKHEAIGIQIGPEESGYPNHVLCSKCNRDLWCSDDAFTRSIVDDAPILCDSGMQGFPAEPADSRPERQSCFERHMAE